MKFYIHSQDEALRVLGEGDKNIRLIEKIYDVNINYSFEKEKGLYILNIDGEKQKVMKAYKKLSELKTEGAEIKIPSDVVYITASGKPIKPQSINQKKYISAINKYDIVIAIGPAGTGKTFLAVACALAHLDGKKVSRIVLSRPVVEAGEKLGFLPGDLYEKIDPYIKPLYDAFFTMLGAQRFRRYRDEGVIEIIPLAYMRGRTIEDAFIILDEAQNTTVEQMKMFLTRTGLNSKVVVTGDVTQIDLDDKSKSGLVISQKILSKIKGIKFCYFSEKDVIKHVLVKEIIKAYETWEKNVR